MVDFCHILPSTGWSQWHNDTKICICYVLAGRSRQHDEYWQDLRVALRSRHDDTKHCKSSLRRIFPTVTKHWKSSFRLVGDISQPDFVSLCWRLRPADKKHCKSWCHHVGDFGLPTWNIANLRVVMSATSTCQHEDKKWQKSVDKVLFTASVTKFSPGQSVIHITFMVMEYNHYCIYSNI